MQFEKLERPKGVSIWVEGMIMLTVVLSSYIFFKQPFEFYFHYIIFLGLLPFFFLKYRLPKFVLQILLFTLVVGLFYVAINGYETFQFIKVWGGLLLSLVFYSYVIQYFKYNVEYIFKRFIQWGYYTCVIGMVQVVGFYLKIAPFYDYGWLLNKWKVINGGILGIRINSIYSEPSTVAVVIAPVVYVAIYNLILKQKYLLSKIQSLIVIAVYIGTSSSTAYIGIFFVIILVTDSIRLRYTVIGLSIAALAGWGLYSNIDEFRSRVDTSIGLWVYQDYSIQNTNTSSFVLYNSYNIAVSNLKDYPVFGTGLGSYEMAYEEYSLTKSVISYDFEFNRFDGNSMLLRLMVETGLIGVIFIGIVIFRGFIGKSVDHSHRDYRIVSQAIFVMMALYLLRQGNYFLNGLPLFYLLYYYNWKNYITNSKLIDEK